VEADSGNTGGIMPKKKRVTRKKLLKEPDEFITLTGKIIRWANAHQKVLTFGGSGFFIFLVLIAGLRYYANMAENTAFQLLDQIAKQYQAQKESGGPLEAYLGVKDQMQYILDRYHRNAGGRLARVVFAGMSYDANETDKAIQLYEAALRDLKTDLTYKNFILSSLGYAYEQKQDYQRAINHFQKITAGDDPLIKDMALFNLGRLYGELGESAKSKQAFQRLVSDHSDSIYFELAKESISGELTENG
jgi:tetratricopeptide (TPR) repeat protein